MPAYNEERGLNEVLAKLRRIAGDDYELLVVDDGSTDRTAAIAAAFDVAVIRHPQNLGKGAAIATGLAAAACDRIVLIDADDTYPVEIIPNLVSALDRHDLVVGARVRGRGNIPLLNRLGNRALQLLIRVASGSTLSDPLSGLYGARRASLQRMDLRARGFGIEAEIAVKSARLKLRVTQIPITYRTRVGDSKLSPIRDGARIALTVLAHAWHRPPTAPRSSALPAVPVPVYDGDAASSRPTFIHDPNQGDIT